jgi:alpha-D-ribose 1-methylphosphonate 5-triphosphate synthase subunit PhnH
MSFGTSNNAAPDAARLKPGFANPVFDSQATFRAILDAMSYAGRVQAIASEVDAPAPLDAATAALALTLFDFDTPVWLDAEAAAGPVPGFLKFHCGCPITGEPEKARFGVSAGAGIMAMLEYFPIGEDQYPDRSATIIVQVPSLTDGPSTIWSGPGILEKQDVRIGGLPDGFWAQWALNHELYPLGLDLIFVSGREIIGLPRSVKVEG